MILGQGFLKSSTFDFIQIPLKHRHFLAPNQEKLEGAEPLYMLLYHDS